LNKLLFIRKCMLIIMYFSFIWLSSCKNPDEPESRRASYLSLEVDSHYDNNIVELRLDDKFLLKDTVTTNYSINAAWLSGNLKAEKGVHKIDFRIIDLGIQKTHYFVLEDTLTVLISNRNSSITFSEYKSMLLRL
jgi:hypothetical protein